MDASKKTMDLSPLDQIMPRVYSRLILAFPCSAGKISDSSLHLRAGLDRLISEVEYFAGEVVPSDTGRGALEIRLRTPSIHLVWSEKDLRATDSGWTHSYEGLRAAGMPLSKLEEGFLAPVSAFPMPGEPAPVMKVQCNSIVGGLLLCVCVHHSVMDGPSLATVLQRWADITRNETDSGHTANSSDALLEGSLGRSPLIKGLPSAKEHAEYEIPSLQLAPPPSTEASAAPALPPMAAATFVLSAKFLTELKGEVSSLLETQESWVSTNDAVSALMWRSITAARSSKSSSAGQDAQSAYGMAPEEINLGHSRTLAKLAMSIRNAVTSIDDAHIRSVIHLVNSLPDVSVVLPAFSPFLTQNMAITSWASLPVYDFNWGDSVGDTGKADFVRIPKAAFDGLCIILPQTSSCEFEVIVGLKSDHMENLKRYEYFKRFAELRSV
ncbi:MAG: hypothetical protein M1833_002584 [Piccolia ochrophora]|nr:MAG: hypothetical protein M1833_002584 [Piccolia ochrophora]